MTSIRNIAIIAHVDHGKTTLVDKIMYHCQLFRENENTGDLILDNNDLERERGITITSKNVSVVYKDTKINIIDTPGHIAGRIRRGPRYTYGRFSLSSVPVLPFCMRIHMPNRAEYMPVCNRSQYACVRSFYPVVIRPLAVAGYRRKADGGEGRRCWVRIP